MAKRYTPATTNNSSSPAFQPGGELTKKQQETVKNVNQDVTEIAGKAFKQRAGAYYMEGVITTAAQNHANAMDRLQEIGDQDHGKNAQRQIDAMNTDLGNLSRHHQFGMADAAGYGMTEIIERDVAPAPKEPGLLDGLFGKKD